MQPSAQNVKTDHPASRRSNLRLEPVLRGHISALSGVVAPYDSLIVNQLGGAGLLLRHFAASANLAEPEIAELRRLMHFVRQHGPHTELCAQGELQHPRILLSGWACQQRVLRSGRRQIIRFLLPGDLIGSLERPLRPAISNVIALSAGALADARPLVQAAYETNEMNKGLASLVRTAVRAEEVALHDHIVRLGGRTAYERLVHLMLELHSRLCAVGLAAPASFSLPLTQEVLADALGMSFVHTNRTLQQIRRDGLFMVRSGVVTILDMEKMHSVAEWSES